MVPNAIHSTVPTIEDEEIIFAFWWHRLLPLDNTVPHA
jgi:hypothetical protein